MTDTLTSERREELIAIGERCCFGGLTMTDVADLLTALRRLGEVEAKLAEFERCKHSSTVGEMSMDGYGKMSCTACGLVMFDNPRPTEGAAP